MIELCEWESLAVAIWVSLNMWHPEFRCTIIILYKLSIKIDILGCDDLGQTKYHITG